MEIHPLTLFFKLDTISEIMHNCDLSENGHKIFCEVFDVKLETEDGWSLSPAVIEVIEKGFNEYRILNKVVATDECPLCGVWDAKNEVFYNFTDKKDGITMFSDGKNFAYMCTERDIKKENYIKAYKQFIFNSKQAKDDKYVYKLSSWMVGDNNDSGE